MHSAGFVLAPAAHAARQEKQATVANCLCMHKPEKKLATAALVKKNQRPSRIFSPMCVRGKKDLKLNQKCLFL